MLAKVDARFDDCDALAFEQAPLKRCIWVADENSAGFADDAVPGNASSRWGSGHGAASRTCSAAQAQGFCQPPICENPPARDLFHEIIDRLPGHRRTLRKADSKLLAGVAASC